MLKQSVVYANGVTTHPETVAATVRQLPDADVVWLDFVNPTATELDQVKTTFQIHDLVMRDISQGSQRPKIEDFHETRFIVLRPARMLEDRLHTGECYLLLGPNFVITARFDDFPDLEQVDSRLAQQPDMAASPLQLVQAILTAIFQNYKPVMSFLRDAIDDVEEDIIIGHEAAPHRVYELLRNIMKLQRSVHPLPDIMNDLRDGVTGEIDTHLRSIEDHTLRLSGQVDGFRDALTAGLQLHAALLGQRQNEEMARVSEAAYNQGEQSKKVSAWAAILFTPTVIAGIYGMNFHHMPGLTEWYGFTAALIAMVVSSVTLYFVFKRQQWL